jgi:hypothetical protein
VLNPGDIVDRYVVEGEIAAGGMAEVYRVRHQQLDSLHALKVLVLRTPDIRRRLLQEGRVQAALKHPNAIMVTDVVDVDGHPGLVMEFVDGPTLGDWVQVDNPGYAEIERVFRDVVSAVGEAHRVGLIHRDLKPSNVLMARAGERLIPKVIDFGLAKVVEIDDQDQTRSGVPMGTPSYMAPEQIADAKTVDARADLFSLGALLYYMICHRKAFDGANAVETYNAVLSGAYTPPSELRSDIPANLRRAIEVCLRRNRERRVRSAEDLLGVLDGLPAPGIDEVVPPSPSPFLLLRRAALVGAGLGAMAAVTAVVAWNPAWIPPLRGPTVAAVVVEAHPPVPLVELDPEGVAPIRSEVAVDGSAASPAEVRCGAALGELFGYARGPTRVKRGDEWVLEADAPLSRAPNGASVGCALPMGTRVTVRDRPHKDGGDHWLAVYGGSFELPPGGVVARVGTP